MLKRISRRSRRALIIAVAAVAAAAMTVVPLRAMAQDILNTDLEIEIFRLQKSGNNLTATIRVVNNGPESLPADSYVIDVRWNFGVRLAGTQPCHSINELHCEIDGRAVEYVEIGPLPGPRFNDYVVRLTGTTDPDPGFISAEIDQIDYIDFDSLNYDAANYTLP